MPSASKAQYKLMEIASYNKEFAEARHLDQKTAREWHEEDKKKRKEDPDWYKGLPEKAENDHKDKPKKKKKSRPSNESISPSFEGILSKFASLFGGAVAKTATTHAVNNQQETEYSAVLKKYKLHELSDDPKFNEKVVLNTGVIKIRDVAAKFHLKQWNASWLSQIEQVIKAYGTQYATFMKKRETYTKALERIYKHCETLKPEAALEYAKVKVAEEKKKMGQPPKFNFPQTTLIVIEREHENYKYEFKDTSLPESMPVPDHNAVKKLIDLLYALWDFDLDDYDCWTLDDTDEYKWWENKYPDEENAWGEMLTLFPAAGYYYEFDLHDTIDSWPWEMEKGLVYLIGRSIKSVNQDA